MTVSLMMMLVISSSCLLQRSESFILIPTTTFAFTFTSSTRHVVDLASPRALSNIRPRPVPIYSRCHPRWEGVSLSANKQQSNSANEEEKEVSKPRRKNRTWEESFQLLVSYKEKHGNCNVPTEYKDVPRLGNWVRSQRRRKDRLSDERIAKLDDLGFLWSNEIFEEQWDEMFEKLVEYTKRNNGDCNIPYNVNNNDDSKELYKWVEEQRKRKSILSKERQTKLDKIGLIWEDANKVKADEKWNEKYKCLKDFKEEHGHCKVPRSDPSLGLWVSSQRHHHRKGLLRIDRQMKLDEIDFTWKVRNGNTPDVFKLDLKWLVKFGILLNFLEEHGHCDVPNRYTKNKSLGLWVNTQRQNQMNGNLRQDRKELLDDIGLTWSFNDQKDEQWKEKYQELKTFKERNGHLRLPETSRSLIDWVSRQRVRFAAGRVSHERKALLDEINFRWDIQTRSR